MTKTVLTHTRIRAGIWEGILAAKAADVRVTLLDRQIEGVTCTELPDQPGHWALRVPIPTDAISDGVHTFVISHPDGARFGHFTLVAGTGLEDDIRAEMDLLRAELDMLKKAFRRHCLETAR